MTCGPFRLLIRRACIAHCLWETLAFPYALPFAFSKHPPQISLQAACKSCRASFQSFFLPWDWIMTTPEIVDMLTCMQSVYVWPHAATACPPEVLQQVVASPQHHTRHCAASKHDINILTHWGNSRVKDHYCIRLTTVATWIKVILVDFLNWCHVTSLQFTN